MAISGAQRPDDRRTLPLCGMRYFVTKKNAKGVACPMINVLVPAKTAGKASYMHAIPVYTRIADSEFARLFLAVTGRGIPPNTTARACATILSAVIIERNGGLKYREVARGKFREWTGMEFVDLGSDHPGALPWPEGAIDGIDLFQQAPRTPPAIPTATGANFLDDL